MDLNNPEIIKLLSSLTWQGIIALSGWTLGTIGLTYKVISHFQPVVQTDSAECELFREHLNANPNRSYQLLKLTRHNKKAVHINCPLYEGKNKCVKREDEKCKYFT